jgi:hypothetical protein
MRVPIIFFVLDLLAVGAAGALALARHRGVSPCPPLRGGSDRNARGLLAAACYMLAVGAALSLVPGRFLAITSIDLLWALRLGDMAYTNLATARVWTLALKDPAIVALWALVTVVFALGGTLALASLDMFSHAAHCMRVVWWFLWILPVFGLFIVFPIPPMPQSSDALLLGGIGDALLMYLATWIGGLFSLIMTIICLLILGAHHRTRSTVGPAVILGLVGAALEIALLILRGPSTWQPGPHLFGFELIVAGIAIGTGVFMLARRLGGRLDRLQQATSSREAAE